MTFGAGTTQERKNDLTRQAVALAMDSRWAEAAEVNRSILDDFPNDLETCNRLGKALSELGRNGEARKAFERALSLSPNNPIAKKNLDRLSKLGDEVRSAGAPAVRSRRAFIEESGKSGVTSLVNLARPDVLVRLAPGHPVELAPEEGRLKIAKPSGEYVGQVEPKLASRLTRLMKGGNRYEGAVTSVGEREITVMISETYKHQAQAGIVSFPSKDTRSDRVYLSNAILAELADDEPPETEHMVIKDWSDDDTEPGDDDAFTPVFHRIIKAGEEGMSADEEEEDV
jgi:tetratricopeptide (TPR) repeat protein